LNHLKKGINFYMIDGGGKLKIKNLKVVTVFGLKFQETKIFKVFKMLAVHNY